MLAAIMFDRFSDLLLSAVDLGIPKLDAPLFPAAAKAAFGPRRDHRRSFSASAAKFQVAAVSRALPARFIALRCAVGLLQSIRLVFGGSLPNQLSPHAVSASDALKVEQQLPPVPYNRWIIQTVAINAGRPLLSCRLRMIRPPLAVI